MRYLRPGPRPTYGSTDLGILLSGNRYRCFQKIGQLTEPQPDENPRLYAYAKVNKLLDARIRICDGRAVSYYPDPQALGIGRYKIVIDISANHPVEFDELDQWAQRQYDADRARHVHQMERDARAARRRAQKTRSQRACFNRAENV